MISAEGVIAAEWCLFTLAFTLAVARIAMHVHMDVWTLLVSDMWLLVAILDCMGLIICDTMTYKAGAMSIFLEAPLHVRQMRFATNYLFDFGLYFPKFSMLAFYTQIIPHTSPELRKALYAVITFVTCSSLTTLFADTFWCGTNISINWSVHMNACSVFASMPLAKMNWALNVISEVLILLLPFPLIRGLNLRHRREKAGLLVVFLLGAVTITVSTARFIAQLIVSNNIAIYILAMTEYTISIMILSLICLRPLLRKIYRMTSSSQGGSPFSRSNKGNSKTDQRKTIGAPPNNSRLKGPRTVYHEGHVPNMYGSEVELTELGPGKIYNTEEISVTSARETDPTEKDKSSREGAIA